MKLLQEVALTLFAIIILVFVILSTVIMFNWLGLDAVNQFLQNMISNENAKIVLLILNIIFTILAFVCIFYDSEKKNSTKDGVLLENEKGNLLISRNALIKLIEGVVNEFESVKLGGTHISLDKEGFLVINIQISVTKNVVIKDLSNNIQIKVKDAIKKSSDLDVKTVNIGIQSVIESEGVQPA